MTTGTSRLFSSTSVWKVASVTSTTLAGAPAPPPGAPALVAAFAAWLRAARAPRSTAPGRLMAVGSLRRTPPSNRVSGSSLPGARRCHRFVAFAAIGMRGLRDVGYVRITGSTTTRERTPAMATGETGFTDIAFDLVSIQYHALKAGHDYGQYVRDAENAGQDEVASFFKQVQQEDQERAQRCSELLKQIAEADHAGPAAAS